MELRTEEGEGAFTKNAVAIGNTQKNRTTLLKGEIMDVVAIVVLEDVPLRKYNDK